MMMMMTMLMISMHGHCDDNDDHNGEDTNGHCDDNDNDDKR